jgi:rod shape determining protein RodA
MSSGFFRPPQSSLVQKLGQLNWGLVLVVTLIASVGFAMLYSAANGNIHPWASRQMLRFGPGLVLMIGLALVDIRFWLRNAYILYLGALALLVAVEFVGAAGMGAQRWISLGPLNLQPSEVMKLALIVVLARYLHSLPDGAVTKLRYLIWPMLLSVAPALLVLRQPDLGTAMLLLMIAAVLFFIAGVRLWNFGLMIGVGLVAVPIVWQFLKPYQKQRILSYLDPESDPLGSGYHILQSKIALGSGGLTGKGFLNGSQAHLNFLPEKHRATISCNRRSPWARAALPGRGSSMAVKPISTSCRKSRPISSSPCWPRNSGLPAASACWRFMPWCWSTAFPSPCAPTANSAGCWRWG